jgi:hypothetical protein
MRGRNAIASASLLSNVLDEYKKSIDSEYLQMVRDIQVDDKKILTSDGNSTMRSLFQISAGHAKTGIAAGNASRPTYTYIPSISCPQYTNALASFRT